MSLSETARERLADIVALQPTKNGELQDKWGMDSGSEVHSYLEDELGDYYYRNDNSLICATPAAENLVGDGDHDPDDRTIYGSRLEEAIVEILPGPDGDPQSVVATLHALETARDGDLADEFGDALADVTVDDVRSALFALTQKDVLERVETTVPTFRLAVDRDHVTVMTSD